MFWSWDLPRRVGLSLHVHLSHGSDLIAFRCEAGHSPLHYSHLPHHLLAAGKKWRRNKGNARETVHSIIPAIFTLCLHQWLTLYFPLPPFLDTLAVLHGFTCYITLIHFLQRIGPTYNTHQHPGNRHVGRASSGRRWFPWTSSQTWVWYSRRISWKRTPVMTGISCIMLVRQ